MSQRDTVRSSRQRVLAGSCRVLSVLLSLWVWLACGSAQAATLEASAGDDTQVDAPMCDINAASVAASPDMDLPLIDRGRFEELPCDALALQWLSHLQLSQLRGKDRSDAANSGDPDRPEPRPLEVERARFEAAQMLAPSLPQRTTAVMAPEPHVRGLSPSPAHRRGVYRPPLVCRRA